MLSESLGRPCSYKPVREQEETVAIDNEINAKKSCSKPTRMTDATHMGNLAEKKPNSGGRGAITKPIYRFGKKALKKAFPSLYVKWQDAPVVVESPLNSPRVDHLCDKKSAD